MPSISESVVEIHWTLFSILDATSPVTTYFLFPATAARRRRVAGVDVGVGRGAVSSWTTPLTHLARHCVHVVREATSRVTHDRHPVDHCGVKNRTRLERWQ